MARKLRAVGEGEVAVHLDPKTLTEAVELDRRTLLVRSRLEIAKIIDGGVPAHTLGRLISDMSGIDSEIRRLDSVAAQEDGRVEIHDEAFDAAAI